MPSTTNHPKRKLLFFVAQDIDDNIRVNVRDFVLRLASRRRWINGAPRFVNSVDEPADTSRGDIAVETVGGFLEIESPPLMLPREIALQYLDEVIALIEALCDFSREYSLSIEFEFDGELIGAIDEGEMDHSLADGLLGEWRRHLKL